jgi:hypothetical protein
MPAVLTGLEGFGQQEDLHHIVDELTTRAKLEVVQAVNAHLDPARYYYRYKPTQLSTGKTAPDIGQLILQRYGQRPDLQDIGKRISTSIERIRKNRNIDLTAQDSVREHSSFRLLEVVLKQVAKHVPYSSSSGTQGGASMVRQLQCRVRSIKCIDETNPESFGSDEMAFGGVWASSFDDQSGVVAQQILHKEFEDGVTLSFQPPRVLKAFALQGNNFPRTYSVMFAVAEKDNGGFAQFLADLYKAVKTELNALFVAIGASIGGAAGSAIGGPLGTLIGVLAGAIVGAVIAWIVNTAKDDMFEPQMTAVEIDDSNPTFANGSRQSQVQTLHFHGHGGHYRAALDWFVTGD